VIQYWSTANVEQNICSSGQFRANNPYLSPGQCKSTDKFKASNPHWSPANAMFCRPMAMQLIHDVPQPSWSK